MKRVVLLSAFLVFSFMLITGTSSAASPVGGTLGDYQGQTHGWAQDSDCSGTVTSSFNGCPLDIHLYVDGPAGAGTAHGTRADQVVVFSNKDNYLYTFPAIYQDGLAHTVYAYAIGKDEDGNNDGDNILLGTHTFTYPAGLGAACQGRQCASGLKCVTGSGGFMQCKGDLGYSCVNSNQCATPYTCTDSKCQEPRYAGQSCSEPNYYCVGTDAVCSGGTCKLQNMGGSSCNNNNQCLSGYCNTNTNQCQDSTTPPPTPPSSNTYTLSATPSTYACNAIKVSWTITGTGISASSCSNSWGGTWGTNQETGVANTYSSGTLHIVPAGGATSATYYITCDEVIRGATSNVGTSACTPPPGGTTPPPGGSTSCSACPSSLYPSTYPIGSTGNCYCSGIGVGSVWGTGTYTSDSTLCLAAKHAGRTIPGGISYTVTVGQSSYSGSTANGVTTLSYGPWSKSFTVGSSSCTSLATTPGGTPPPGGSAGGTTPPPSSAAQFTGASFRNLQGNDVIATADKGDRVMLRVDGTNLANKQITFKLYKKEFGFDTFLNSPGTTITAQTNTYSTINLTLSQSQLSNGGTVYFKAETGSLSRTSADLAVNSVANNAPPIALISTPVSGGIYFTGNNIAFTHTSTDIDSNITSVLWNFGDGTTSSQPSSTKSYSSVGQKTISLTVTDEHGATSSQIREIMVANPNGYSLFNSITRPFHREAIINNNLVVNYDASDSYVISATTTGTTACTVTITCVQGKCPAATNGVPSCSTGTTINIPPVTPNYGQMNFSWAFKDGNAYLTPEVGYGKVSGTKGYSSVGQKNITLLIKYASNGQNLQVTQAREFTLFNQRQCSENGATWYRINTAGYITDSISTLNTVACSGTNQRTGEGYDEDDCCPVGFMCSTDSSPGCKLDSNSAGGCGSYNTMAGTPEQRRGACIADGPQRVKSDILWNYPPYNCGKSINGKNYVCKCAWENNRCLFNASARYDSTPITGITTSCTFATTTGECADGYQAITIDAISNNAGNDPLCTDSTATLPCGRPVVALPFVGKLQLALAIIVIALVYAFLFNKNRKKRR